MLCTPAVLDEGQIRVCPPWSKPSVVCGIFIREGSGSPLAGGRSKWGLLGDRESPGTLPIPALWVSGCVSRMVFTLMQGQLFQDPKGLSSWKKVGEGRLVGWTTSSPQNIFEPTTDTTLSRSPFWTLSFLPGTSVGSRLSPWGFESICAYH